MSLVQMSMTAERQTAAKPASQSGRRAHWMRPALGLVLPVMIAVVWELVVRAGWASGRLVPPPSVIFNTFAELWRAGELQRHILVTTGRVAAGFGIGVVAGTLGGAICGYSVLL